VKAPQRAILATVVVVQTSDPDGLGLRFNPLMATRLKNMFIVSATLISPTYYREAADELAVF
jgi:hypothetical protein